ncbi:hypothetical protein CCM_06246 [Cordyceps militaris CM01]|uniref:Uncharacterized protein n=1 Tax=Cordyceps militaris (strain CM01) TaxID=983644 RepID=G3JJJ8_CORMM|nr:uncharacterized protein CCM_06246 [Cordyceps militaris CM01]EGX92086.1 hypothetical protein CCM_06246 [Cordyceps militaris CM01]
MRPSVEPAETHHDGNILQSRGYRGWKLERWTAMARKWIRLGLELSLSSRRIGVLLAGASTAYTPVSADLPRASYQALFPSITII